MILIIRKKNTNIIKIGAIEEMTKEYSVWWAFIVWDGGSSVPSPWFISLLFLIDV